MKWNQLFANLYKRTTIVSLTRVRIDTQSSAAVSLAEVKLYLMETFLMHQQIRRKT